MEQAKAALDTAKTTLAPATAVVTSSVATATDYYTTYAPSTLQQLTQDELALAVVTVLPALCMVLAIIGKLLKCCSSCRPAAVAPSGKAPAKGPPPLETRKTVISRGKKDAPDHLIAHQTRGKDAKNPKGQAAYMA